MKFDKPATTNPIDQMKVVGQPHDRIDGPLKTTGYAPYAYERHDVVADPAYGFILGAGVAKGRMLSIDTDAARSAPGVLTVVTWKEAGPLGKSKNHIALSSAGRRSRITTRRWLSWWPTASRTRGRPPS